MCACVCARVCARACVCVCVFPFLQQVLFFFFLFQIFPTWHCHIHIKYLYWKNHLGPQRCLLTDGRIECFYYFIFIPFFVWKISTNK